MSEPTRMDRDRRNWRASPDPRMLASILVSFAVILGLLYVGQDVLIPLAIAFLISFALSPLVRALVRRRVPRVLAVSVVMGALVTMLAGLMMLIVSQLGTLSGELPTYQSTISIKIDGLARQMDRPGMFDGMMRTFETVREGVGDAVSEDGEQRAPMAVEIIPDSTTPIKAAAAFLVPVLAPLATLGIVFVFVFLALLDQGDLRDRLLRILGGNLHRSTDALAEAGRRISRYLLMQVVVNVTYAIPMAVGLWLIGVPGFILWGTLAALMRFVPYVGPILSAIFPLTLAFAVDPGWNMVLLALALIVVLELISNNIVEPILYGTSTGLSALSLIAAATFWTAMWGPTGLILSTPLTVCLLVIGRNIPQLQVLETLLGSAPALDVPTRIYQRLIADDVEEAMDIASDTVEASSLVEFYDSEGLEILRRASIDFLSSARPEHRLRIVSGMDMLMTHLRDEYPPSVDTDDSKVACIGGKWEIDNISCRMLSHSLATGGTPSVQRTAGVLTPHYIEKLDLTGVRIVCIAFFSSNPGRSARVFCRRLRERWPDVVIILGMWNVEQTGSDAELATDLGADHVVHSIGEAQQRIEKMLDPLLGRKRQLATPPENDADRVTRLRQTHVLDNHLREELDAYAKRAAEVFDTGLAVISALDASREFIVGQSAELPGAGNGDMVSMPRSQAICDHVVSNGQTLVIRDTHRDPRFADHPTIETWGVRFYAGTPIQTQDGQVLGAISLLDAKVRDLTAAERTLLEELAAEASKLLTGQSPPDTEEAEQDPQPTTATTAQLVPD